MSKAVKCQYRLEGSSIIKFESIHNGEKCPSPKSRSKIDSTDFIVKTFDSDIEAGEELYRMVEENGWTILEKRKIGENRFIAIQAVDCESGSQDCGITREGSK